MASVVIAAHNEEAVIGTCIDALTAQLGLQPIEVIVSANGCTDRTAQVAAERNVRVLDRTESGKAAALNAGEAVAKSFPRIYLDADIVVPPSGLERILDVLDSSPQIAAAVPLRRIDTTGRSLMVRAYFAINERLPAFRNGLFGRGMIVLTEAGRRRFSEFPALIADDLFLDSLFSSDEKCEVRTVEVVVGAPYGTRDLLNRLVRVRRGNAQMRAAASNGDIETRVRSSDKWSWLRDVVFREPRLVFAAVPYVSITVLASLLARRPNRNGWGRDLSTRTPRAGDNEGNSR